MILFFEVEFFIMICKKKSWIKRFFLLKSALKFLLRSHGSQVGF